MYLVSSYVPQQAAVSFIMIQSEILFQNLQPHRCCAWYTLKKAIITLTRKENERKWLFCKKDHETLLFSFCHRLSIWYCILILISNPIIIILFHKTWLGYSRLSTPSNRGIEAKINVNLKFLDFCSATECVFDLNDGHGRGQCEYRNLKFQKNK